jgi:hypothetical protein
MEAQAAKRGRKRKRRISRAAGKENAIYKAGTPDSPVVFIRCFVTVAALSIIEIGNGSHRH